MVVSLPYGVVWLNFEIWEYCPILILHTDWILGLIFIWETEGLRTRVLYVKRRCISELDVAFESPKSNLYSPSYGPFPWTATVGLFICYVWIFGLISMQIS